MPEELEWKTRKDRVDRKLTSLHPAWAIVKYRPDLDTASLPCHAVEEYPTQSGPADYALFVKGRLLGIIEAKKVKVGPANVLEQAKRYARGASDGPGSWLGFRVAVARILNGYAFKSAFFSKEKGFPLIRIRDIARNKTETYYNGPYPQEYIVRSEDLLIGMDGNFCCYQWKGQNGLLNQRVCKIIPNERFLDKKFLLFAISGYLSAIQKATSSVTVGHLSSRDVLKIPFPLPPRNEQHRIVAKLEKLLAKVDACKERLEKIPAILKRFRQSVLAVAFSGSFTSDIRNSNFRFTSARKNSA